MFDRSKVLLSHLFFMWCFTARNEKGARLLDISEAQRHRAGKRGAAGSASASASGGGAGAPPKKKSLFDSVAKQFSADRRALKATKNTFY
jgi:hypothetical protein